jgi:hypothetical protein
LPFGAPSVFLNWAHVIIWGIPIDNPVYWCQKSFFFFPPNFISGLFCHMFYCKTWHEGFPRDGYFLQLRTWESVWKG